MNKTLTGIQEQLEADAATAAQLALSVTVEAFRKWLIENADCDISETTVRVQSPEMSLENLLDMLAEASKPFVVRKFQQKEINDFIARTKVG